MDATLHLVRRRFLTALGQAIRCDCQAIQTRFSRPAYLRQTPLLRSSTPRFFSSCPSRWLEEVTDPDMKISNSLTHPSSPAQTTPKQSFENYISSIRRIIDGYQLHKKENLHEKLHSNLVVALANAEANLNAPGAASESFDPLLRSLQGEISPVLQNRFRTTNVSQIIADIGKQPTDPPRGERANPAPESSPPVKRQVSVAEYADTAFSSDAKKLSTLEYLNRSEDTEKHGIRGAVTEGGTVNKALGKMAASHESITASRARGPTLRLTSSLGKSVEVSGGTDLTRAFQRMEMICSRNGVKRDVARQRFHVRRGQLKKQMRMERWRRLFKEGFIAECSRVRRMRRQGW